MALGFSSTAARTETIVPIVDERRNHPSFDAATILAMARRTDTPNELTPLGDLHEGSIRGLLGYQLAQATILTTSAFDRVVGKPLEMRPVEFTILQLVLENPSASATQLARALAVTTPGITIWLDKLEERGLVQRVRSDIDKRKQDLRVTPKGQAQVATALERLHEADRELLAPLSEGERRMLLELLHKVAHLRAS